MIAEVLDDEGRLAAIIGKLPEEERAPYHALPARIREIKKRFTPDERARLRALGDKQVLPVPTDVSEIHAQLCRRFLGAVALGHLGEVALIGGQEGQGDGIFLPQDRHRGRGSRIALITLLLRAEVLPRLGRTSDRPQSALDLRALRQARGVSDGAAVVTPPPDGEWPVGDRAAVAGPARTNLGSTSGPAPARDGWLRCTLLQRYHLRAVQCCII